MAQFDEEGDIDMSDSEEWYYFALDDEKKKRSKRSLFDLHEIGSSSMDVSGKVEGKSIPLSIRKIEGMEIKDAVKENVLPFLPAKILTRFRSVSKQWDHWIQTPFLAHQQSYSFQDISGFFCQHGDKAPTFLSLKPAAYGVPTPPLGFLPDHIEIICSCHGLLVCQDRTGNNNPYYICNPASKSWKELPKPDYYHGRDSAHVLAFEPCMQNIEGHYQLVCAVPLVGQPIICFEIYSSETRSWRCSDAICVELGFFSFKGVGFYMKGTAYWITSKMQVLAFDLKNEVYGIIPLPSESSPRGILAQIHEELCYICISNTSNDNYVIKMFYGYDLRLRRGIDLQLVSVPSGSQWYRILPCFHGDKLMILVGNILYSYSLSDGRIEVISSEGVESPATTKFLPYVNSLVRVI